LDIPASDKESESSDFGNDDDDYSTDLSEDELQEMEHIDQKMKEYMKIMDSELNMTDVGRSFARKKNDGSPSKNSIDQEDDDFKPVDIDRNLVSNMLQSYWSEKGMGGPASSLLRSLNVNPPMIPEELDSDDEEDINE
uniref:SPT6_acidic domain-containing protein n=1 Tax=Soboliphyme baturini TaxID=241478 RepID=A0A183I9P3_9BILA